MQQLFAPVVPDRELNRAFKGVMTHAGHRPARDVMQQLFDQLPNPDPNFVKDFQTSGFDARIWELYLFALALERGWNPRRPEHAPDFFLEECSAWLEAVTANPTQGRESTDTDQLDLEGLQHYVDNVLPIKLGSPLTSKLAKRYWELPHVAGKPIVLAIADFHDPSPFRWNEHALSCYLYGLKPRRTSRPGEIVTAEYDTIAEHRDGTKVIPSGFFSLLDAAHVSAVMFSNAGTVSKFNRMAYEKDKYQDVAMMRWGFASDPDPAAFLPAPFDYIVGDHQETWGDGITVFHNPNALHPIDRAFFAGLTQHWLSKRGLEFEVAEFHPFSSNTFVLQSCGGKALSQRQRQQLRDILEEIVAGLSQYVTNATETTIIAPT